jgi:hypothetical protein
MSERTASSLHAPPSIETEPPFNHDDDLPRVTSGGCSPSSVSEPFENAPSSEHDSDDEQPGVLSGETVDPLASLPAASMLSYWSANSKEFMRDTLVKVALIALFTAGIMRTSIPSLIYATVSVQALYSRNRVVLRDLFPTILAIFVSVIAIGMIIFHIIVNETSAGSSPLLLQVRSQVPALCVCRGYSMTCGFRCSALASFRVLHQAASMCHLYPTPWRSLLPFVCF